MKSIYLNQLGYLPNEKKVATCKNEGAFLVLDVNLQKVVYEGTTSKAKTDDASGDEVCLADFTALTNEGTYLIRDAKGEESYSFQISGKVYEGLHYDLIKALYFQRCGCALEEKYAGIYHHKRCHFGLSKVYENQLIEKDMTGGWHDAGDYGRYISPAAVTIGHILYAYLMFPKAFSTPLDIPETGNGVPDALNECRYELEWMLKMQREDGGVYHKLTAVLHAPFIMPEEDEDPFFMFAVSSMATADFAACMALAYRVYRQFDQVFADEMLAAAKKAYGWLKLNPDYLGFQNPEGSNTGEYDDDRFDRDERLWAAAEMLVTLGENEYEKDMEALMETPMSLTDFGWVDVSGFASMAVLIDPKEQASKEMRNRCLDAVRKEADRLKEISDESGFGVAMKPEDYIWGSNMVVTNRGILLLLADYLVQNNGYREAALGELHYLLGRNAVDYSYVTGEGEHAFSHPHNRATESAGLRPMRGWVSGGPNKTPCDEAALKVIPEGTKPMKCYLDDYMSYSTNEITIYWNSSAAFLVSAFV